MSVPTHVVEDWYSWRCLVAGCASRGTSATRDRADRSSRAHVIARHPQLLPREVGDLSADTPENIAHRRALAARLYG